MPKTDLQRSRSLSTGTLSYNQEEYVHTRKWTMSSDDSEFTVTPPRLPLVSFNHISREVRNLELSRKFYCDILGFVVIPRPPFDCEGFWLYGYGVSIHLIETRNKRERTAVFKARINHFSNALPRVDHIAFITHDLDFIQGILDNGKVYYKKENPVPSIQQLFFFDPDGNVIEVSNCAPEVGEITCSSSNINQNDFENISPTLHDFPSCCDA